MVESRPVGAPQLIPFTPGVRDLTLCLMGHSAFQYFYAGLELGLFTTLERQPHLTVEDVAREAGLEHHPARCLLFGLTALGLLCKDDDGYTNAEVIRVFAAAGKLDLLLKVARFQARIVYPGEADFLDSLRRNTNQGLLAIPGKGGNLYHRIMEDPALEATFFDFMSAWSAESVPLLIRTGEFEKQRSVIDVGGGDGTVSMALAAAFPHLEIQLLDIPPVCPLAERRIRASRFGDQVRVSACDVFSDPFPEGVDCFLFSHFLVIWSPEQNTLLLSKAFDALAPGGTVIIFNSIASDEGDGPLFAALDAAYFVAVPTPGGLIYSWNDYEQWLRTAGFQNIRRVPGESWTPHGTIIGTKPA